MQHLAARFADQAMTRIRQVKEAGREAGARDVIVAILAEALPAAARRVPDRDRSNSVTPSSRSSAAMDRLRAGCAMCSISAARP
jgi:hypothetical protein